jgi:hypothetical protein
MFFHILGIIIPTDFHIFQMGRYTTKQNMIIWGFPVSLFPSNPLIRDSGKGGLNGMFSAGMGWQVIQASALGSKRGSGELWIHRLAKLAMAGQNLERPSGKTSGWFGT